MTGIKKVENGRSSPLECEYCGWPNNVPLSIWEHEKNPHIVMLGNADLNVITPNPEHWAIWHQREYHFDKILERLDKLEALLANGQVRWFYQSEKIDKQEGPWNDTLFGDWEPPKENT